MWFSRSRSSQSKSVQYHHILTIEGEIALLRSTAKIARQHIIKELTGKKHLYALRAFYIT